MQAAKVRNAGIQEPVATSPSHQESHELLKGKAKITSLWLYAFSHITTICYVYYAHYCAWYLSLALSICRHMEKKHICTQVATTTHDLIYPDLCALDWRARLWCIVHRKAWFNSKNRKSPHRISVIHFEKSQRNNVILTELSLWGQPLWKSNIKSNLNKL